MGLQTVCCEPSPVGFLGKHKKYLQFSEYCVRMFVGSFPDSQDVKASQGVGRVLWVRKVVCNWLSLSTSLQEVCGKINFYELFANMFANTMFASVYAT